MHSENIYNTIEFDNYSITPKYIQLANSISKRIEDGTIEDAYILPSINNISYELDLSRNTVEKAYRHLKERGFINSVPGKGYFVQKTNTKGQIKIFLIFNKLSVHKKIIYDAFANALGNNVIIDFYIYNNDFSLFKKLLTRRKIEYSYYVIIPHFMDDNEKAYEIINQSIPEGKLILMSQLLNNIVGSYGAIYEDFERNIYGTLSKAIEQLKKYNKLNIIFPEYTYHPNTILKGFSRFCQDYAFDYGILNNIQTVQIEKHAVYISLMEDDLVILIKKILESKLEVGKEVGIISYNETPIKQIILNGITTISADFKYMGQRAAEMIIEKQLEHSSVPFYLTLRASL